MPEPVPSDLSSLPRGVRPARLETRPTPGLDGDRREIGVERGWVGRVAGSAPSMLALPDSPRSPSLARAFVAETLRNCPRDLVDTAVLLVSEVVTNAVRHAAGNPLILVIATAPALVVSVEDASPAPPAFDAAALHAENGRGLGLVDALATAWGWHRSSPGKVVWFELGNI